MTFPTSRLSSGKSPAPAFTLLELLLVLGIATLLVGAVSLGVLGGVRTEYLDEGADRFETVLRMARIEAAQRARKMQLRFDEQGGPAVYWEPSPLEEPGTFALYTAPPWTRQLPRELVRVVGSRITDVEQYRPAGESQERLERGKQPLHPLTFYPDGSCDSAVIQLRSTDERDKRTAIVQINGLHGLFFRKILTPSEYEVYREAEEAP